VKEDIAYPAIFIGLLLLYQIAVPAKKKDDFGKLE
jgi:hypothetical protein